MLVPSCVQNVNKQGTLTVGCCCLQENWEQVPKSGSVPDASGLLINPMSKKSLNMGSVISGKCFLRNIIYRQSPIFSFVTKKLF